MSNPVTLTPTEIKLMKGEPEVGTHVLNFYRDPRFSKLSKDPQTIRQLANIYRTTLRDQGSEVYHYAKSGELAGLVNLLTSSRVTKVYILQHSTKKGATTADTKVEIGQDTIYVEIVTNTGGTKGRRTQPRKERVESTGSAQATKKYDPSRTRTLIAQKIKKGQISSKTPGVIFVIIRQTLQKDQSVLTTQQMTDLTQRIQKRPNIHEVLVMYRQRGRGQVIERLGSKRSGLGLARGSLKVPRSKAPITTTTKPPKVKKPSAPSSTELPPRGISQDSRGTERPTLGRSSSETNTDTIRPENLRGESQGGSRTPRSQILPKKPPIDQDHPKIGERGVFPRGIGSRGIRPSRGEGRTLGQTQGVGRGFRYGLSIAIGSALVGIISIVVQREYVDEFNEKKNFNDLLAREQPKIERRILDRWREITDLQSKGYKSFANITLRVTYSTDRETRLTYLTSMKLEEVNIGPDPIENERRPDSFWRIYSLSLAGESEEFITYPVEIPQINGLNKIH